MVLWINYQWHYNTNFHRYLLIPPVKAPAAMAGPPSQQQPPAKKMRLSEESTTVVEGDDTLGMLLRNGKRGVTFKPYSDSLRNSKSHKKESRVQRGCKRRHDELSLAQDELHKSTTYSQDADQDFTGQGKVTINHVFPEILTLIFEKLDVQSRGRAAQVRFSLFGIIPWPNRDVEAFWIFSTEAPSVILMVSTSWALLKRLFNVF